MPEEFETHYFRVSMLTKDKRIIDAALEIPEVYRIISEVRDAEYQKREPTFAFQYDLNPKEIFYCTTLLHRLEPNSWPLVTNDKAGN